MAKKKRKFHNNNQKDNYNVASPDECFTPRKIQNPYVMPKFNVVFLDVDGVICLNGVMNKTAILNVKSILNRSGAILVLSSNWRLSEVDFNKIVQILQSYGIQIHDITRDIREKHQDYRRMSMEQWAVIRNTQIREWVYRNQVVAGRLMNKWIAIDDLPLALPIENFVKTQQFEGFVGRKCWQAQNKLSTHPVSKAIFANITSQKYEIPQWWHEEPYTSVKVGTFSN